MLQSLSLQPTTNTLVRLPIVIVVFFPSPKAQNPREKFGHGTPSLPPIKERIEVMGKYVALLLELNDITGYFKVPFNT
jgi:hypothetical protein